MAYCGRCAHLDVCKTAETCDGRVPGCKHFMDKDTFTACFSIAPWTCQLGSKGCYPDGGCRSTKTCAHKVFTHADQLRAMTDEELAKFLLAADQGNLTVDVCDERYCTPERCPNDCANAIIEWLRQPVEGKR